MGNEQKFGRDQRIEDLAVWLHDNTRGLEHMVEGYEWPLHDNDDGYRGGNAYVRLIPKDIAEHHRDLARRVTEYFANQAALAAAPKPTAVVKPLDMFAHNVDAWGAAEWFGRMADAVRGHDAARASGDEFADITAETFKNVMTSSAFRLVRDFEAHVRSALASPAPAVDEWLTGNKLTPDEAWTILCETPDVTSPEEYPDHALITLEQLRGFMERAASPAPATPSEVERLRAENAQLLAALKERLEGPAVTMEDFAEGGAA